MTVMKKFFLYKTVPMEQINEIIKIEPQLSKFIDLTHPFTVRIMPDYYQCFIHSVISQQLASAAVDSI
jgi:3-methyladenine DNA glycosylase/8-oxoguanine DNA glycosylase